MNIINKAVRQKVIMNKILKFFVFALLLTVLSVPSQSFAVEVEVAPTTGCPIGTFPRDNGDCAPDVCFNMRGAQAVPPTGYTVIDDGKCVPDVCPNIPGAQSKLPNTYWIGDGECRINVDLQNPSRIPPAFIPTTNTGKGVYDACPNIPGLQGGVPAGYTKDMSTNKCKLKPVVIKAPIKEKTENK